MNDQPIVIVQNQGCLSGCWTFFWVMVGIGALITYPLVAIPVAVLMVGGLVWLQSRDDAPTAPAPVPPAPVVRRPAVDVGHLKELAALREAGHLSEAEFESLKAKALRGDD